MAGWQRSQRQSLVCLPVRSAEALTTLLLSALTLGIRSRPSEPSIVLNTAAEAEVGDVAANNGVHAAEALFDGAHDDFLK